MEVTQEKWTEITVTVDTKDIETAGNIANMVVPYGIYIEDYSALEEETMEIAHIDLIEASLLQKDRTKGIIHGPVRHGGLGKQLEKIFSPYAGRRQAADPPHLGGRRPHRRPQGAAH